MGPEAIAIIVVLIGSIILHEMAHGYMANYLGDPTARLQGRLSPNPLVHIDPLGSVIIPGLLFFSPTPILFGWAKPVPYNPYNLTDQKYGEAKIAIAGPLTNIGIAFVFAVLIRSADILGLNDTFIAIASYAVFINILLALFNMIPIPPLDGSKILMAILPFKAQMKYMDFTRWVERNGLFVMFAFIFLAMTVLIGPLTVLVNQVFILFTGMSFF